jgi:hypothetical protein
MYRLPDITELMIVSIEDPGVSNRERIVMQVAANLGTLPMLNLASFALIAGPTNNEAITPLPDHFFWLGDYWVHPGSWVIVLTGSGQVQTTKTNDQKDTLWQYWGKPSTIFPPRSAAAPVRAPAAPPPPSGQSYVLGVALIRLAGILIRTPSR